MRFDDGWFEVERLHQAAVDATAEICVEWDADTYQKLDSAGAVLYHYMSHWYPAIVDSGGALAIPVVTTSAWFVDHMIEEHGLPEYARVPMLDMLVKFSALVITKCAGRLL